MPPWEDPDHLFLKAIIFAGCAPLEVLFLENISSENHPREGALLRAIRHL